MIAFEENDRNYGLVIFSVNFVPVYDEVARQYICNRQIVEIIFKGGEPLALYESGYHKVFITIEIIRLSRVPFYCFA